jgi:hypothetical protein
MNNMTYTRQELRSLETIEQAWDGDELKIQEDDTRVWLVTAGNRPYNGDYIVETLVGGRWLQDYKTF